MISERAEKRTFIDCRAAIESKKTKLEIIRTIERFFGCQYWQPIDKWQTNFSYLYKSRNYSGKKTIFAKEKITKPETYYYEVETKDWFELEELVKKSLPKLEERKFNKDLL